MLWGGSRSGDGARETNGPEPLHPAATRGVDFRAAAWGGSARACCIAARGRRVLISDAGEYRRHAWPAYPGGQTAPPRDGQPRCGEMKWNGDGSRVMSVITSTRHGALAAKASRTASRKAAASATRQDRTPKAFA